MSLYHRLQGRSRPGPSNFWFDHSMRCWGELKSLRVVSFGEVSADQSCVKFSGYAEMKSARPTTSPKAGYVPGLEYTV